MTIFQANALRAEIIRDLAQHPEGATTHEIGERVGVVYNNIYRHVIEMKAEGIVVVKGQGEGYRRGVVYQLDREALQEKNAAYMRHLLGK